MTTMVLPDFSELIELPKSDNVKEMLSVTAESEQTIVRINSSSLGIILSCGRKAFYSLFRKLKTAHESPALVFGTAIHKALEVFYSYPKAERNIPIKFRENSDLMAFGHAAPTEHFLYQAMSAFVTAAQPLAGLPDTDKRSIANGVYILQHYFNTYINDPYIVYSDANGPVTERTFELVLHENKMLKIILFGTIDVVLQNLASGQILPGDHKTTSQLGSDFFNRLKPNHQYTGYIMGAQRVLGLDVSEFLVNGIQVKAKPLTARGSPPNFTRQVTRRSDADIEEFKQSVLWAVTSFLEWSATSEWPMGHVNECTAFGGCQYLEVCGAPSQLRENLLSAKFKGEGL